MFLKNSLSNKLVLCIKSIDNILFVVFADHILFYTEVFHCYLS